MCTRPGFYYEIGKKARDLLYKDYNQQSPHRYHYGFFDWNFDLALQIDEIVPGLNAVVRYIIPDSTKVELRYLHDYCGITAGIGMAASPFFSCSGVIGASFFSLGADLTFDTASQMVTKYNAGLSISTAFIAASFAMKDKGDTLNAACYRAINTLTNTGIAAELSHSLSLNEISFALGMQHGLTPSTMVKARVNTYGKAGALIQHELWPNKLYITVDGEVDAREISNIPKVGLSVALRP